MNELVCKTDDCDTIVTCEENIVAVTCHMCCATIGTALDNE